MPSLGKETGYNTPQGRQQRHSHSVVRGQHFLLLYCARLAPQRRNKTPIRGPRATSPSVLYILSQPATPCQGSLGAQLLSFRLREVKVDKGIECVVKARKIVAACVNDSTSKCRLDFLFRLGWVFADDTLFFLTMFHVPVLSTYIDERTHARRIPFTGLEVVSSGVHILIFCVMSSTDITQQQQQPAKKFLKVGCLPSFFAGCGGVSAWTRGRRCTTPTVHSYADSKGPAGNTVRVRATQSTGS